MIARMAVSLVPLSVLWLKITYCTRRCRRLVITKMRAGLKRPMFKDMVRALVRLVVNTLW